MAYYMYREYVDVVFKSEPYGQLKSVDIDEKNAGSNNGATSDMAKENQPENKSCDTDDKDESREEEQEQQQDKNYKEDKSIPKNDTTINDASSKAAQTSSSNATATSDNEHKSDKNKSAKTNPGRSLWITNLLPSTRAQELKHLLSRYGKVIGAKVVQSSRYPRTRCYGYVTMETRSAADLCIEKLNNTELKGQIIRVAKVRPEHSLPLKPTKKTESGEKTKSKSPSKQTEKSATENSKDKSTDKKKPTPIVLNTDKKKDEKSVSRKDSKDRDHHKSRSSSRKERSLSKSSGRRDKRTDVLTFDKIRDERERQRARERERAMREEEKRRREIQRAREIEKRQREEAIRLDREREKLRIERDRLDRQRQEILRLERERQKLEREKLEQEKQELRRQQMRLEEARRPLKRPAPSSSSSFRRDAPPYTDDRKRVATERHYDETPPPPRFEVAAREPVPEVSVKKDVGKDYKSRMAYPKRAEDYSKRSEYKRDFPSSERHSSGGHTGHMVHGVNSNTGPSKFETPAPYSGRERERERDIREPGRREAMVPNVPPPRITKDTRSDEMRYSDRGGERSPVSYRPVRDDRDRRPVSEHHAKADIRSSREHRYGEPSPNMKEGARYRESNSWHSGGPSASKPFSGMSSSANSSRESWSKSDNWRPMESGSNERWVGNNSSRLMMSSSSGVGNSLYSGGNSSSMSGMGSGLSCPPPPGSSSYAMDRFDNYKSMNNSRKY